MKVLLHFYAAMRPKAKPLEASLRTSTYKVPRASGVYDELIDAVPTRPIDDGVALQPYDEIPDAAVNIPPYQNLISDNRDRGHTGVSGKREEDDPGYMVPHTDLYNTNTTDKQSLIDPEKQTLKNNGYLILQADCHDVTVEELAQKGAGDVTVETTISDLYAVVQKKKYQPLEPLLRNQPQSQKTDNYAQLEGNKTSGGADQLNNEEPTFLADSIEFRISGQGDIEGQDGDVVKNKHVYNQLDPNTKECLTKEYTPLGNELRVNNGQRVYNELTPGTREPTPVKSPEYTKLQQQETRSDASGGQVYHGLDSATKDTEPRSPHDYASLTQSCE